MSFLNREDACVIWLQITMEFKWELIGKIT